MPGRGHQRFYRQQQAPRRSQDYDDDRQHQQQPQQAGMQQLLQLLPVLLLVLMTFSSFGGGGQQAPFSLARQGQYQVQRETSTGRGLVGAVPYFVTSNFRTNYGSSASDLLRVEKLVEAHYKEDLTYRCQQEENVKRQRILQVSNLISSIMTYGH